jgi:hypothetical protein
MMHTTRDFRQYHLLLLLTALATFAGSCDSDRKSPSHNATPVTVAGRVAMPGPVRNATIEVYRLKGTSEILLGTAFTEENGHYSLSVTGLAEGTPFVIKVRGEAARYTDFATGDPHQLKSAQLAAGFVWNEGFSETLLIIDPFSTLAYSLARAYYINGAGLGLTDTSWNKVLVLAPSRLADHLDMSSPPDLGFTDPVVITDEPVPWPSSRTVLSLGLAGLSHLAATWGRSPGEITVPVLVNALSQDLADGLLDGMEPGIPDALPSPIELGGKPVTGQTTRYDLAQAIHTEVWNRDLMDRNDALLAWLLGAKDGMYESISLDHGPLYSVSEPPELFDPLAPLITWVNPIASGIKIVCDEKPLPIKVEAFDEHELADLQMTSPKSMQNATSIQSQNKPYGLILTAEWNPSAPPSTKTIFIVEATDASGNVTFSEISLITDCSAPAPPVISPSLDHCFESAPSQFLVSCVDDVEVASVTVTAADLQTDCSSDNPTGTWACPNLSEGDETIVFAATDHCGRTTELSTNYCLDNSPPKIQLEPPTGAWYGPESNVIKVIITDEDQPSTVIATVNSEVVQITENGGHLTLLLPISIPSGIANLAVEATDPLGHTGTLQAVYHLDESGPSLQTLKEVNVYPSADFIEFSITAADDKSGLDTVIADADTGTWQVKPGEGSTLVVTGSSTEFAGPIVQVEVTAWDLAGNQTTLVIPCYIDKIPPEIGQSLASVVDERFVTPVWNTETDQFDYPLDGAPIVKLNQESCLEGCPAFGKYANRLILAENGDPAPENLAYLGFIVNEPCPDEGVISMVTPTVVFAREGQVLSEVELPAIQCGLKFPGVPIAFPFFSSDELITEDSFTEERIPDTVTVTVTDEAGNSHEIQIQIELVVLPPPLIVEPMSDAELPTDLLSVLLDSQQPALDALLEQGGVHHRMALTNPTAVYAEFTLAEIPTESVLWTRARIYVEGSFPDNEVCTFGFCSYDWGSGFSQICEEPQSYGAETAFAAKERATRIRWSNPEAPDSPELLKPDSSLLLGPEETIWLDVLSRDDETMLLAKPATSVTPSTGGPQQVQLLDLPSGAAQCSRDAFPTIEIDHYELPMIISGLTTVIDAESTLSGEVSLPGGTENTLLILAVPNVLYSYSPPFKLDFEPF